MSEAPGMIAASPEVDRYLDGLPPEPAGTISRLRDGIRGVAPAGAVGAITRRVKAPLSLKPSTTMK